jgi:hypothetical protein
MTSAGVDDISWEGTIGVVDQDSVDTLKHELGVLTADNYGLLEAVETVEECDVELMGGETPIDVDVTPTSTINLEINERLERL